MYSISSKIKSLQVNDQFKIYKKCLEADIPIKYQKKNVEINLEDLSIDILEFIEKININKPILKPRFNGEQSKLGMYGKYDVIPNLFDSNKEVVLLSIEKEIVEKNVFCSVQQNIRKKLRECIKTIVSCKKAYIEKDYGKNNQGDCDENVDNEDVEIPIENQDLDQDSNQYSNHQDSDQDSNQDSDQDDDPDPDADADEDQDDDYNEILIQDDFEDEEEEEKKEYVIEDTCSFFETDFESILEDNVKLNFMEISMDERYNFYKEALNI
jgi:hypothetical protein